MSLRSLPTPPLVLAVVALAYLPVLAAGFVWDDALLVVENTLTGSLLNLPRFFAVDLWSTTPNPEVAGSGYYRPLVLLDFAIDRAIFGLWAPGHHLHSLAWHLGAVALLGALARRLGASPLAAACAMALLGVHPAGVEAVAWISARNDLMATTLTLGTLLLLLPFEPSNRRLAWGGLTLLAALLSKENAVMVPLIIALMRFLRYRQLGPRRVWGVVALAVLAWLVLRLGAGVGWPAGATTDRVLPRLGAALAWWGHDLVSPVGLAPGRNLTWSLAAPWLMGILGWGVAAALLAFGGRMGTLGAGLAVVTLLPALAAVSRTGEVADRYLYLPLAGLGLALAGLLSARAGARTHGIVLVGILVLGGFSTSLSLPTWASDRSMWLAATQVHPSPYTWGGLAKTLEDLGELDDAAHAYRQATAGPKPFPEACYNVSNVHLKRGDPALAAAAGQRALANGCPPSAELLSPTAVGLAITGRWEEAEGMAGALSRDPRGMAILVQLAAAARRGDLAPLRAAQQSGRGDPALLQTQVAWLLDQAGEVEVAQLVRSPPPPDPTAAENGADPEAPPAEAAQGR